MVSLLSLIGLGFLLGMRHATDADHVIAVSTIVARHKNVREAAWVGVFWGLGHSLTVFCVGGAIILLGIVIPGRLGLSMEFAVAVMLIVLGAMNMKAFFDLPRAGTHSHAHAHGDYVHTHEHAHAPEKHPHNAQQTPLARLDARFAGLQVYQWLRPMIIGVVHGLAGSSAVALLVLAAIRETWSALAYLAMFGAGTIVGMALATAVIAVPLSYAGHAAPRWQGAFRLVTGAASAGFGIFLAYRIGIVEGLFALSQQ